MIHHVALGCLLAIWIIATVLSLISLIVGIINKDKDLGELGMFGFIICVVVAILVSVFTS